MSKTKIGNDIRSQFTAANRIVTELSKFGPAQRERILSIVGEHKFEDAAPKVPENQEAIAFS